MGRQRNGQPGRDGDESPPSRDSGLWRRARQQVRNPLGWNGEDETERDVEERHEVRYGRHGEPVAERRERIVRVRRDTRESAWTRAFRWLGRLLLGLFVSVLVLVAVPYTVEEGLSLPVFAIGALVALWLLVYGWDALGGGRS